MASIRKEIHIDTPPDAAWDALRDWPNLHTRLVPGFVTDACVEGDARVVTFANGATARELIVDVDDEERRLVWAVTESPMGYRHHSAAAQVTGDGEGGTVFSWHADFLPDELAPAKNELMDAGMEAIRRTLERATPRSAA